MKKNRSLHTGLEKANHIAAILKKCIDKIKLDNAEQQALDQWLADSPYNQKVFEEVTDPDRLEKDIKEIVGYNKNELWCRIKEGIQLPKPGILFFFRSRVGRYAAAIAVLLTGACVHFSFKGNAHISKTSAVSNYFLSDGTQVILNSESTITYPAAFTGNLREVTIAGEAYLKWLKMPRLLSV